MTRAIILENEQAAMEALASLIEQYCPTVKLVGKAYTVVQAKNCIDLHSPDLIFMDIELDTGNSLELLTYYESPQFDIVFTTAHEKYAIQAIKASCLDYLIKPIDYRELQQAVIKHEQKFTSAAFGQRLQNMIDILGSRQLAKVAIPTEKGFEFFNTEEIIMCQAEGSYTRINTPNQRQYLTSKSIGEMEALLASGSFFRCHKSYMVNLKHILKFDRAESQIVLTGNIKVDLAARRKEEFLELIHSLSSR